MKNSKLTLKLLGILMVSAAVLSINSCGEKEPDPILGCTDSRSDNFNPNANQNDGSCDSVETVNKFVGTYAVTEQCPATDTYAISVSASGTTDYRINITNFYGTFTDIVIANVSQNTFVIPAQTFGDINLNGNGNISGDTLNYSFTLVDPNNSVTCTAVGVRQ